MDSWRVTPPKRVPHLPGVPHLHVNRPLVWFECIAWKQERFLLYYITIWESTHTLYTFSYLVHEHLHNSFVFLPLKLEGWHGCHRNKEDSWCVYSNRLYRLSEVCQGPSISLTWIQLTCVFLQTHFHKKTVF